MPPSATSGEGKSPPLAVARPRRRASTIQLAITSSRRWPRKRKQPLPHIAAASESPSNRLAAQTNPAKQPLFPIPGQCTNPLSARAYSIESRRAWNNNIIMPRPPRRIGLLRYACREHDAVGAHDSASNDQMRLMRVTASSRRADAPSAARNSAMPLPSARGHQHFLNATAGFILQGPHFSSMCFFQLNALSPGPLSSAPPDSHGRLIQRPSSTRVERPLMPWGRRSAHRPRASVARPAGIDGSAGSMRRPLAFGAERSRSRAYRPVRSPDFRASKKISSWCARRI